MAIQARRRPDAAAYRSDLGGRHRLSIAECRRLLDDRASSNAQIELVRDQLYSFAEAVVIQYARRPRPSASQDGRSRHLEELLAHVPDSESGAITERAGILEFEGGFSREEAERKALADWLEHER